MEGILIKLALFLREQASRAMYTDGFACICVCARAYHSNAVIPFPSSFRSC